MKREEIEEVRDWLILTDRHGNGHEDKLKAVCDLALMALSAPSEAMPEAKRWHWTGQLCHFVDGYLIGTMEHSIFRSDSSPAVVLWDDYLALSARLRAAEGDLEHERKFRIIAETNESVEIQRAESATRELSAIEEMWPSKVCDALGGKGFEPGEDVIQQCRRVVSLLESATREREEMAERVKGMEERFKLHTEAVGQFLNDLYAIMVDPCAVGAISVTDMKSALLQAATRDREAEHLRATAAESGREDGERLDWYERHGWKLLEPVLQLGGGLPPEGRWIWCLKSELPRVTKALTVRAAIDAAILTERTKP